MNRPDLWIRDETIDDLTGLMDFTLEAFALTDRGRFINSLRPHVVPLFSLVAESRGHIVGHALTIKALVRNGEEATPAAALGILAVHPDHRRKGISGRLFQESLRRTEEMELPVLFAVTEPDFFTKFAFSFASTYGLHYKWIAYDSLLLVREIRPGALETLSGTVDFTPDLEAPPGPFRP